jgi:putative tributyrin esterase
MKKQLFYFLLLVFAVSIALGQTKVSIIEDSLFSKSVNSYMRFNVILPANYYSNEERYTTLYLLHGYSGNQDDWVTRTGLIEYMKNYNIIIVTPDGKNSWYTNSPDMKNRNYEDYIMKELIPAVENKYRTLSTRHGRAIAGLSMGGYGAIKLALKYPGTFYYAASFSGAIQIPGKIEEIAKTSTSKNSPSALKEAFGETRSSHWDKNDPFVLVDSLKNPLNIPYLYFSVGKDDRLLDANRALTDKLRIKGCLYEYHESPGIHNWIFWDKEINELLRKLAKYDPLR